MALRNLMLLVLDDLVAVVREFINPNVSRSGLDRYLFVAIDRATRWVFMHIYANQSERSRVDFVLMFADQGTFGQLSRNKSECP